MKQPVSPFGLAVAIVQRTVAQIHPADLEGNLPMIEEIEAELDDDSLSCTDKGEA